MVYDFKLSTFQRSRADVFPPALQLCTQYLQDDKKVLITYSLFLFCSHFSIIEITFKETGGNSAFRILLLFPVIVDSFSLGDSS